MYAGHFGVALGASSARPRVALAWFVAAALLSDLLLAALGVLRLPEAGPLYSHGLLQVAGAAAVLGLTAWRATRDALAGALIAGTVVSHVLLDYVTTRLAVWAGGPEVGVGLFRHPGADFLVEGGVVLAGWLLYRRATRGLVRRAWPQVGMLAALVALQAWFDIVVIG